MNARTRSLLRPLNLLLVAAIAAMPAVHAGSPADNIQLASADYRETSEGALVLRHEPRRLSHQASEVASDCVSLKADTSLHQRGSAMLINHCAHAVTVSYCVDAEDGGARRCAAIGHRGFEAVAIAAGAQLALSGAMPVDAGINWVACKAGEATYSTLINNGTRGECLVEQLPATLATAEAQAVIR